MYYHGLVYVYV
jgi:hypothetical protein